MSSNNRSVEMNGNSLGRSANIGQKAGDFNWAIIGSSFEGEFALRLQIREAIIGIINFANGMDTDSTQGAIDDEATADTDKILNEINFKPICPVVQFMLIDPIPIRTNMTQSHFLFGIGVRTQK